MKKTVKWDAIKIENFCFEKETVKKNKGKSQTGKSMYLIKVLYPKHTKNCQNSTIRKGHKEWAKVVINTLPKNGKQASEKIFNIIYHQGIAH